MIVPYYRSAAHDFTLLKGDCFELLSLFKFHFDMIFADPPYFLSNDGLSVQAGKIVSVNKGEWDRGGSPEQINDFNRQWISLCREKLKDEGTIWISGTYHNIFSVANSLTELGFKILNVINNFYVVFYHFHPASICINSHFTRSKLNNIITYF